MMNTKVAHTGMINNNRTNRERINKASATTSETLSAANGTKSSVIANVILAPSSKLFVKVLGYLVF